MDTDSDRMLNEYEYGLNIKQIWIRIRILDNNITHIIKKKLHESLVRKVKY